MNIFSTYNGTGYAVDSGTSMAAPHVSGAAALYKLQNPEASPIQVMKNILAQGSSPIITCDGGPRGYFVGDKDTIQEPLLFERLRAVSASSGASEASEAGTGTQTAALPTYCGPEYRVGQN